VTRHKGKDSGGLPYAAQITFGHQRQLPFELVERFFGVVNRLWRMLDAREPDTPEARASAVAEMSAVLDEAKATPVVTIAEAVRRGKGIRSAADLFNPPDTPAEAESHAPSPVAGLKAWRRKKGASHDPNRAVLAVGL
jgi:hypothetical protein